MTADPHSPPAPSLAGVRKAEIDVGPEFFRATLQTVTPPNTLTMAASTGAAKIVIHLDTGEVDLLGLEPSEGARLFWKIVEEQFGKRG
jgi:hypothetical protein